MNYSAYITKLSRYLPSKVVENQMNRLTKKTGILQRHIAAENETAADLAVQAVSRLNLSKEEKVGVDFLIFCSQSPDYILPPTACLLQDRLGLSTNCGAFDYNLGCSGYIYGLSMAKGFVESGQAKRVLLITAETYSKYTHPQDNTVVPLFGDAATATIIEAKTSKISNKGLRCFSFGTDGSGARLLIIPSGGSRAPYHRTPLLETVDEHGNIRTNRNLYMSGAGISEFALKVVPNLVENILQQANCQRNDISYFVFHQANNFMLQFLQQKCDLTGYPYWNNVREYGNTVSNSIPLALYDLTMEKPINQLSNTMLVGFGVGLSWAGCLTDLSQLHVSRD